MAPGRKRQFEDAVDQPCFLSALGSLTWAREGKRDTVAENLFIYSLSKLLREELGVKNKVLSTWFLRALKQVEPT